MPSNESNTHRLSRRQALAGGIALATGVGGAAIATRQYLSPGEPEESTYPEPVYGEPDREFSLTATTGEIEVAPNETVQTWLYDGQYPGPELRVEEGERVRITVENDLDAETAPHWHGMEVFQYSNPYSDG